MERWSRKVAVVTGCSSGIGESIARHLCKKGMIVIGLARRVQRLESLSKEIGDEGAAFRFHECDVSNRLSVKSAFAWIAQNYPNVSVLVNNAGVNISTSILAEDNEALLESVVNTNLMGALYCTKEVHKIMKQANEDEFYIININSILGHNIFRASRDVRLNVYPSSKFGLRAASEVMRLELLGDKRFHISSISPGLVKTEIVDMHPDAKKFIAAEPSLNTEDIAKTVEFILTIGSHVQIADIIIKPVGERI